jgi:hypothetical protein
MTSQYFSRRASDRSAEGAGRTLRAGEADDADQEAAMPAGVTTG